MKKNDPKLLWYDRRRVWCGLPWTFTKYGISEDRFFLEKGLFSTTSYEVRLYRITNVNLKRTLIQRIFGLGTVHFDSSDKDLGCFDIANIKQSEKVKEILSEQVESERLRNKVVTRELMADSDNDDDNDILDDISDDER